MDDKVKEKIQELVPEVVGSSKTYGLPYTITLTHVLMAINKKCAGFVILSSNGWLTMYGKGSVLWDFTKNFDDQEQPTKDFIGLLILN